MSCDLVEKSGQKLIRSCYCLQTGLTDSDQRRELINLALFFDKLRPRFTAAGFYYVDQSVLAGVFSLVTTYAIICIQFNT